MILPTTTLTTNNVTGQTIWSILMDPSGLAEKARFSRVHIVPVRAYEHEKSDVRRAWKLAHDGLGSLLDQIVLRQTRTSFQSSHLLFRCKDHAGCCSPASALQIVERRASPPRPIRPAFRRYALNCCAGGTGVIVKSASFAGGRRAGTVAQAVPVEATKSLPP